MREKSHLHSITTFSTQISRGENNTSSKINARTFLEIILFKKSDPIAKKLSLMLWMCVFAADQNMVAYNHPLILIFITIYKYERISVVLLNGKCTLGIFFERSLKFYKSYISSKSMMFFECLPNSN